LRSSGRCRGNLLSFPITRFEDIAAIIHSFMGRKENKYVPFVYRLYVRKQEVDREDSFLKNGSILPTYHLKNWKNDTVAESHGYRFVSSAHIIYIRPQA
jgi:hypothetical protein